MPDSEAMTIDERRKCIKRMQGSYLAADRAERGRLLSHLAELTDLDRKTLIRLLRSADLARHPRARQRGRAYGLEVDDALRVIWETLDYVCAERLTPSWCPPPGCWPSTGNCGSTMRWPCSWGGSASPVSSGG
jgi:hypothetical protein